MKKTLRFIAAIVVVSVGARQLVAQSIEPLGFVPGGGPPSLAAGISGDGNVVVGSGSDGTSGVGFSWKNGVMTNLGRPLNNGTTALSASFDGSIVVGHTTSATIFSVPLRWTNGVMETLNVPPGDFLRAIAAGVSGDGITIVGAYSGAVGGDAVYGAVRWINGTPSILPKLTGDLGARAEDASADGSVLVGASGNGSITMTQPKAVRWTQNGTVVENVHPAGWDQSFATAVSADGSVVVGWVSQNSGGRRPFRWKNGIATVFDTLPNGTAGEATDVSGDGNVIVGTEGIHPIIWGADTGWRTLDSVLSGLGVDLQEWTLYTLSGVSDDGLRVTGWGVRGGVSEGYRATLVGPSTGLVVNDKRDLVDADDSDDVCDADAIESGNQCTLRAALQESNRRNGPNTITFDIDGAGPHTILVATPLPEIVVPVNIDATTQEGFSEAPVVELRGAGTQGLAISAGQSVVRGLSVGGFSVGITLSGQGGNVIEGCYIGLDPSGMARPNEVGIEVKASPGHRVGGEGAGQRNVLSGNSTDGVLVSGGLASGTLILGNYIGTNAAGDEALGNGAAGIRIDGAPGTTIGGESEGARNVIAGNAATGIEVIGLDASTTSIVGNYIGVDATGEAPLRNPVGVLVRGTTGFVLGGTARNVILGSTAAVHVTSSETGVAATDSRIEGNLIGLLASETVPPDSPGSAGAGVMIGHATGTVVGGATSTPGASPGNVIGGMNTGVRVTGTTDGAAISTRIIGNLIGLNPAGASSRPNTGGVWVEGSSQDTRVGSWEPGARNVIAGNTAFGVAVTEGTGVGGPGEPTGTVIAGNWIGLKADGTILVATPDSDIGVYVGPSGRFRGMPEAAGGVSDVVIGATAAMAANTSAENRRNVIAGNDVANVLVDRKGSPTAASVQVVGNWIGLKADGGGGATSSTVGSSSRAGVMVTGEARATIGGPGDSGNVIGGNVVGVWIDADEAEVVGNFVGTDAEGLARRANFIGVAVSGSRVTVGMTQAGEPIPNVISGNDLPGRSLADDTPTGAGVWVGSRASVEERIVLGASTRLSGRAAQALLSASPFSSLPAAGNRHWDAITLSDDDDPAENTVVAHNLIGLTAAGDAAVVPTPDITRTTGIIASSGARGTKVYGNTIGGTTWGIAIGVPQLSALSDFPVGTRVAGNRIGLTLSGSEDVYVPNLISGIYLQGAVGSLIGDDAVEGQGPNLIAGTGSEGSGLPPPFNAPGIYLTPPGQNLPVGGNTLRRNRIWDNEGLAIARDYLVRPNSEANTDGLTSFNFPRLLEVAGDDSGLSVLGTSSVPMTVEVFADRVCDSSGHGEARVYLGTVEAQLGTFEGTVAAAPSTGWRISVTGTNTNGTTSEMSPCQAIAAPGETARLAIGDRETPRLDGPDMTLDVTDNAARIAGSPGYGNSSAGTLYVSLHTNTADEGPFEGSATSPDASLITPDGIQRQRFWSIRTDDLDGIVYEACLRIDGLTGLPVPGQLVVVSRAGRGEAWTPQDSFLRSESGANYLCAAGLADFGEFAIGADNAVNPVSIEAPTEEMDRVGGTLPVAYGLSNAHPNPFSASTVLELDVVGTGRVSVAVYDMLGREVAVLADGPREPGIHRLVFDGKGLPSGMYLVRMVAGDFVETQRVTLLH